MTDTLATPSRAGRRLVSALALAASLMLLGAACGDDSDSGSDASSGGSDTTEAPAGDAGGATGGTEVEIVDFTFSPGELTVAAGDTVTWNAKDSSPHTVKPDGDEAEESDDLVDGDSFEITYDEAGEYPYICGIHNYMTGTVIVE